MEGVALSGLYEVSCICWFCDGKVIGLLSPYSKTVVYMPGTSIGFSVSAVSSSCLGTKKQGVVGEQGIVGPELLCVLVVDSVLVAAVLTIK